MRLHENIDFSTLTWVKPELDETLRQARNALQSYVEEGESPAELRTCLDLLHQVQGTLRMVELYGAAMVAEEMEQLAKALIEAKVDNRDNAYAVLMQGIVQLPDYLERLQSGHRDIPIVLLPLLNQLRESRGETGLNESVLFSPDLSRPLPASAQGPLTPIDQAELGRRAEALRGLFQGALLRWLKDDNSPSTIRDLTEVCEQLVPITSAEPARRLFWVAAGTLDALGKNAFPISNPLKQALAKVEREIKRLAVGGDAAFRSDPPIELTKQLLYFVAHEGSDTGRIGEIRKVFGLSGSEPSEAELSHARGSLSGNNRVLMETVAVAIKEDLLRVKDALDLHLRTPGALLSDLGLQLDALDRVADTLGMLGLEVPRRVVLDQYAAVNEVVSGLRKDDEDTLLDIAGALLYVEQALDDQVERLGKEQSRAPESPGTGSESRKLLEVLVKEAIVNFAQARQCFVAFVETHWDHAQLVEVPRLLNEVSGALRMMDMPLPADYLIGVRQFTDLELLRRHHVPSGQQMDRLADALASLEYFLEALRDRRPNRDQILEVARQSLTSLGYWPLSTDVRPAPVVAKPVDKAAPARPVVDAQAPAAVPLSIEAVMDSVLEPQAELASEQARAVPASVPSYIPVAASTVGALVAGFDGASSEEIDDEIRDVFLEEFEEEIENLGQLLPLWFDDPENSELLRPIRRVFHTLKGSGRLVGAKTLGEFSWKVESLLNRVLDGSRPASPEVFALVRLALGHLPVLRAALQGHEVNADIEGLQAIAEQLAAGEEVVYVHALESEVAVADAVSTVHELQPEPGMAADDVGELAAASGSFDRSIFHIDPVLLEILKPEVDGHLEVVDAWLAGCAALGPQPVTDPLLRSIHTMNGAFAMTDVQTITDLTAPLEGFVKRSLAHERTPDAEGVALIADAAVAIRATIRAIGSPRPVLPQFVELAALAVALRDALPDSLQPTVPVHPEADTELLPQVVVMETADTSAIPQFETSDEEFELLDDGELVAALAGEPVEIAPDTGEVAASEFAAEVVAEPEMEAVAEIEAEVVAEPEMEAVAEIEAEVVAEPEMEAVAELEAEVVAEPEMEAVAEIEAEVVAEPEMEAVAELEAEVVAEPEMEAAAVFEAGTAAEAELESEPESPVDAGFELEAEFEAELLQAEIDDSVVEHAQWIESEMLSLEDFLRGAGDPIAEFEVEEAAAELEPSGADAVGLAADIAGQEQVSELSDAALASMIAAYSADDALAETAETELQSGQDTEAPVAIDEQVQTPATEFSTLADEFVLTDEFILAEESILEEESIRAEGTALADDDQVFTAESLLAAEDAIFGEAMALVAAESSGFEEYSPSAVAQVEPEVAEVSAADQPVVEDEPVFAAAGDDYYGLSLDELEALTAPESVQVVTPVAEQSSLQIGDDAMVELTDIAAEIASDADPVAVEADGFIDLPNISDVPSWAGFGEEVSEPESLAELPSPAPEEPVVEQSLAEPGSTLDEIEIEEFDSVDAGPAESEVAEIEVVQVETVEFEAIAAIVDSVGQEDPIADSFEAVASEEVFADDMASDDDSPELPTAEEPQVAESAVEVEPVHFVRPRVPVALDPDDPDADLDMSDLDTELLDLFLEESNDILDHSDGMLARLREQADDSDCIVSLQRDLHTLKGGARMAGIYAVGDLGHAMESLLESVAEGRQLLDATGVVVLERGFDRLHGMVARIGERKAIALPAGLIAQVEALADGQSLDSPDVGEAVAAVSASQQRAEAIRARVLDPLSAPMDDLGAEDDFTGVRAPQEQVRIRADLLDRLVNYAGEVAIYRARLEQQLGAFRTNLSELDQTTTRLREQLRRLDIETEAQIIARYQREGEANDERFDPLELDRFTNQQQLTRGLNESANDLVNLQGVLDELTRQYETLLLQQSRVSSDLQEGLMRTRMVPFDALVPRLRRVLRQAAIDTGKQVQLKVDGAAGEMDRNVLDRMTAPLEHMLRNAMAHGLERPDERRKVRKAEEGTVRIAVHREGSEVVLKVSDDGRGLDKAAIREKAFERGLIKADAELSDDALYSLILESGFSTAESVSRLSGRGVGMDVVYSEIRQLGGTLQMKSVAGQGSEFIIRLPFTLAVTKAVFVRIGDTSFAVPIASVQGVGRIARADLDKQLASGNPVFSYAGEDYAIHDLGTLIGHAPAKAQDSLQMPLLLARSGDLRSAISIDQVLGSREIVVKPVGPQVNSVPGIFGATIMGDGRVVVILDVAPLVRRQIAVARDTAPVVMAPVVAVAAHRVPMVMVVDDSITMRKVTSRVLERNNMEVLTAKDGVDAVEKMAERVPDLVLLDIEMPRMDGYEVAQNMRSDPRLKDVPIIMITSRTGEKHRQRAMDIGVDRYLGKPYQEPELMRNVFEMLGMEAISG